MSEAQSFDLLATTPSQPKETQYQVSPGPKISEDLAANPVERDLFSELESWADKPTDSPIRENPEKNITHSHPKPTQACQEMQRKKTDEMIKNWINSDGDGSMNKIDPQNLEEAALLQEFYSSNSFFLDETLLANIEQRSF